MPGMTPSSSILVLSAVNLNLIRESTRFQYQPQLFLWARGSLLKNKKGLNKIFPYYMTSFSVLAIVKDMIIKNYKFGHGNFCVRRVYTPERSIKRERGHSGKSDRYK